MDAETLCQMAEKAIKDIQPLMADHFHICRWEGKFQCLPEAHTSRPHDVYAVYDRENLFKGLSRKQWDELRKRLGDFWEENKI